jgi:hypothetical protein
MYRICTEIKTGKLIEMQGEGYDLHLDPNIGQKEKDDKLKAYQDTNLDTLKKNAISQGYKEEDIEVKFITNEEAKIVFKQIEDDNAKIPKEKTAQELEIEDLKTRLKKLEDKIK